MKTLLACLATIVGVAIYAYAAETVTPKSQLRHVVSFKFKSSSTEEQKKEVVDAFRALKSKIPHILSLEWGTNVSKEGFDKGFTHCFIVTFPSEKERDAYLVHEEHKKFVELALPRIEEVFVLDFEAKN